MADQIVADASGRLKHRGPDESNDFRSKEIFLGIQRLAIVDLTRGVQPVVSEDGRVVGVINGEVYNHLELAARLRDGCGGAAAFV